MRCVDTTGRLRNTAEQRSDLPGVGDFVAVRLAEGDGPATIEAVLPRTSALVRKAAGEPQLLAANIDVVFIVTAGSRRQRRTANGWPTSLDLFSRRVVGWSMSAAMTAELVTCALVMAIWRRGRPRELLHHSDRGSRIRARRSSG